MRGLFHPIFYIMQSINGAKIPKMNENMILFYFSLWVSYLYPLLAASAILNAQKN